MKPVYHLRAVRLVNWHNFVDETIELDGSLFLIGDNGSGKTTLLDAVHCALTGDWKVELNAAARVAGRRASGRDLAGVVLRYDVEKGYQRPAGAVAYAALELRKEGSAGREAEVLSIGIGVFVSSPEARPEKWGFVDARPIADVPLLVPGDDSGATRPADRRELQAALSAGRVLDLGRYRTLVGERLFGSREHLEQTASFLQAGKAYRELVTKTANFSELFSGLLREPEVEAYNEARRALDAIEHLRADRSLLGDELELLRALVDWRDQVGQEREAVARYEFLSADHALRSARDELEAATAARRAARDAAERVQRERGEETPRRDALESESSRLRASRGAELLERARELEDTRHERAARVAECATERDLARERFGVAQEQLRDRVSALAAAARRTREELAALSRGTASHLGPAEIEGLARLERRVGDLEREPLEAALDSGAARAEVRELARSLRAAIDAARDAELRAQGAAERAREEEEAADARIEELRARGEVAPPLPRLDAALELLAAAGIEARPLYRLLEPRRGLSAEEAGLVERALGPRRLGALVTRPEDHARARDVLLANVPEVPLIDPDEDPRKARGELFEDLGGAERVLDLLRVPDEDPVARSFLKHCAGGLGWLGGVHDARGEFLDCAGRLHAERLDERLSEGPARHLGAKARRAALEHELAGWEAQAREARAAVLDSSRRAREAAARAASLAALLAGLEELALDELAAQAAERDLGRRAVEDAEERRDRCDREHALESARLAELEATLTALRRSIEEQGLAALEARIARVEEDLRAARERLDALHEEAGRARERLATAEERAGDARRSLSSAEAEHAVVRARLFAMVPESARADLHDYVLRTKRGAQVKPENIDSNREEALRKEERFAASIEGAGGVRNGLLWQKYAFTYEREENRLVDSTGKEVDEAAARLQAQLEELERALHEKSEELLERVVLQDLVETLRRDVFDLRDTVRGVNRLIEDLEFGRTRYRIEARLNPKFKRLYALLERSSALSPKAREELKGWFEIRLDDFSSGGEDELPPFLDYRGWYDYHIHRATLDSDGVELTRHRMAQGSGGEQAVPNYLLLFCLTALLYDGIGAKVRLLLLDEAFYGVDAGRRDELLRFCDRAGIHLVLATPELDGVTESLASSTTVFIEKTSTGDVYLWDARFRRREGTLFEEAEPQPDELVLGPSPRPASHE